MKEIDTYTINIVNTERSPHMQISRHWRMQSQRYQLKGYKYEDGVYSFQPRVRYAETLEKEIENEEKLGIEVPNWPISEDLKNHR